MAVPFDLAALEVTGDSVQVVQGVRQVTTAYVDYAVSDEGELGYVLPSFLPDGKDLLFSIGLSTSYQAAWLSLETGERKVVLENARQARYLST